MVSAGNTERRLGSHRSYTALWGVFERREKGSHRVALPSLEPGTYLLLTPDCWTASLSHSRWRLLHLRAYSCVRVCVCVCVCVCLCFVVTPVGCFAGGGCRSLIPRGHKTMLALLLYLYVFPAGPIEPRSTPLRKRHSMLDSSLALWSFSLSLPQSWVPCKHGTMQTSYTDAELSPLLPVLEKRKLSLPRTEH